MIREYYFRKKKPLYLCYTGVFSGKPTKFVGLWLLGMRAFCECEENWKGTDLYFKEYSHFECN